MILIDSHAHLNDEQFKPDQRDVIQRAREQNVQQMINVGCDLPTSRESIQLAEKYPFIYAAVGVHPHEIKEAPDNYLAELREMAKHPKVVAIGEIGLDYYYDLSPRPLQKEAFVAQLNLAKELNLPIIVHLRDAYGDFMEIMRREKLAPTTGVMHCYSGSSEIAQECLAMGFYISFAGPVTFKKAERIEGVAREIPMNRLLVETDCPYLTPVPHRGKRNEPANVNLVAQKLASIKECSLKELTQYTTANTQRLFSLTEQENYSNL